MRQEPDNRSQDEGAPGSGHGELDAPLLADLFWRDEILQVMYWYQGEGLGAAVSARDLQTFINLDERSISAHLERMVGEGYLMNADTHAMTHATGNSGLSLPLYTFTPYGAREGARRFADEFAGLTAQAHGECNNPNCACQTEGPEACESRTTHARSW